MSLISIWSPDYSMTTGQALVTRHVVEQQRAVLRDVKEYTFVTDNLISETGSWLIAWWRLWAARIAGKLGTLYVVCSRSNGGFLRDIPALVLAFSGTRVVVHAHGSDVIELLQSNLVSPLARFLYSRCELVVPSPHLVSLVRGGDVAALHLCENFVPASAVRSAENGISQERSGFELLWNSNIMASKGYLDVVDAVSTLNENGVAVHLTSVGSVLPDHEMSVAEIKPFLEAAANQEWCCHKGRVPLETVLDLVQTCDAVCLPSRYRSECQPLAVIQAMCCGAALIVADTPALRSTVGDYPAEFVAPSSRAGLLSAIRKLAEEKASDSFAFRSARLEASKAAQVRFSEERFNVRIAEILDGGHAQSRTAGEPV